MATSSLYAATALGRRLPRRQPRTASTADPRVSSTGRTRGSGRPRSAHSARTPSRRASTNSPTRGSVAAAYPMTSCPVRCRCLAWSRPMLRWDCEKASAAPRSSSRTAPRTWMPARRNASRSSGVKAVKPTTARGVTARHRSLRGRPPRTGCTSRERPRAASSPARWSSRVSTAGPRGQSGRT